MNKEIWITLGGVFIVVVAANVITKKFIDPALGE